MVKLKKRLQHSHQLNPEKWASMYTTMYEWILGTTGQTKRNNE